MGVEEKMLQGLINKLFGGANVKNQNVILEPPRVPIIERPIRCNAARVYVGKLSCCGRWGDDYDEEYGYRVLSGRVTEKRLRPVVWHGEWSGQVETFVLYPITNFAEIEAKSERIILCKWNGNGKSHMYKQRLIVPW